MSMLTEEEGIVSRSRVQQGLSVALCVFVLAEVNYPLLQPQSRLALFSLLGLVLLFLSLPLRRGNGFVHSIGYWRWSPY
jgi:hypothetical protein